MSRATQDYRKLSSWQGFLSGAALFRDEHCLISVRRSGFEERVKRLYFKDIKAIVVSRSHRFGMSRRVIVGVVLLLLALSIATRFSPLVPGALSWTVAVALVVAWFYVSMRVSCRCLAYTAVSEEELISVRRPWIARKLLAELTPLIASAQEAFPDGWKDSLGTDRPLALTQAPAKSDVAANQAERATPRAGRLTASSVLVASLLLDVVLTTWDMQRAQPIPSSIGSALALVEAAAAAWVLIQNRGIDISLQRLGAAVLIFLGLTFYAQTGTVMVAQVQSQARTKRALGADEIRANPMRRTIEEIYVGGCFVLAILGAFLTLAEPAPRRQRVPGD